MTRGRGKQSHGISVRNDASEREIWEAEAAADHLFERDLPETCNEMGISVSEAEKALFERNTDPKSETLRKDILTHLPKRLGVLVREPNPDELHAKEYFEEFERQRYKHNSNRKCILSDEMKERFPGKEPGYEVDNDYHPPRNRVVNRERKRRKLNNQFDMTPRQSAAEAFADDFD